MASVEELYQEIILEHHRNPRNFGTVDEASHVARGDNPLCGDETTVQLRIADGLIESAGFFGQGCAISLASASMMTEAVISKPPEQARLIAAHVLAGLREEGAGLDLEKDGELASLAGVRKFPARIKCATLPWQALLAALDGREGASSEAMDQLA